MTNRPLVAVTLLLSACSEPARAPSDSGVTAATDAALDGCATTLRTLRIDPRTASGRDLQTALAAAQPGDAILLGEGTFQLDNTLSLSTSCVTVRGAGIDETILDFKGQRAGSDGIYGDRTNRLLLEGFTVRDTLGNAIKVLGGEDVTFRKLRTEWTGPDATLHGAYGIYPVQSKRVLIEECFASGARDSGIYVGQSDYVVVRRNHAEQNVAGIEVENTFHADVYDNVTTANTAGILVFDLPGLPQVGGHSVRVFRNDVRANNTKNFAPKGTTVGMVPGGVGFFVMANHDVEVFGNTFTDNATVHTAVVSYHVSQRPISDPKYDPYPSRIYLHDNTYVGGGSAPDLDNDLGTLLAINRDDFPNGVIPQVLYDGIVDDKRPAGGNPMQLCIKGGVTFANVHLDTMRDLDFHPTFDLEKHACAEPTLAPITWPGLTP